MSIFKRKEKAQDNKVYYECAGLKLDTDLLSEIDRYQTIYEALIKDEKVYTDEDLDKINEALSTSDDSKEFDARKVFYWQDCSRKWMPVTYINTILVYDINEEGVKNYTHNDELTRDNLILAFDYVKILGFIYGSKVGSIPDNKIFKNVSSYLSKEFKVLLNRHFLYYDFGTQIIEYTEEQEYASYISLRKRN